VDVLAEAEPVPENVEDPAAPGVDRPRPAGPRALEAHDLRVLRRPEVPGEVRPLRHVDRVAHLDEELGVAALAAVVRPAVPGRHRGLPADAAIADAAPAVAATWRMNVGPRLRGRGEREHEPDQH